MVSGSFSPAQSGSAPLPPSFEHVEPSGRERRESERVIAYWEKKSLACGGMPTMAELDLAEMESPDWSHRFVIAVDPKVEDSALLMYGSTFAEYLGLRYATGDQPIFQQLPKHLASVFAQGCSEAATSRMPVRLEGAVAREDGREELYRAAFIPVGVRPNSLTCLAFGAFNRTLH